MAAGQIEVGNAPVSHWCTREIALIFQYVLNDARGAKGIILLKASSERKRGEEMANP